MDKEVFIIKKCYGLYVYRNVFLYYDALIDFPKVGHMFLKYGIK